MGQKLFREVDVLVVGGGPLPGQDQIGVNFTHIKYIDSRSAEDLTKATIEGRKQAYEAIHVFRKYVSGMENCYMVSTPNTVGIRESRRIHGEPTLTREDVVEERQFDDSIGYGSFKIDIHDTDGALEDDRVWFPEKDFRYQFPYRIMVPKDIDNLLVAGRCVSSTHEALGSLRLMAQCGVMGQAAGIASVLSIRADVRPRDIEIEHPFKIIKMDFKEFEKKLGMRIVESGACSGCRHVVETLLSYYMKNDLDTMKDCTLIFEQNVKMPANVKGKLVCFGTCARKYREQGDYLPGCPPMQEIVMEYFGVELQSEQTAAIYEGLKSED